MGVQRVKIDKRDQSQLDERPDIRSMTRMHCKVGYKYN